MDRTEQYSEGVPADQVILSKFRQVFHWPLIRTNREQSKFWPGFLEYKGSPWTHVCDPLTYLSDGEIDEHTYAEFIYFHDFTQKFLFPRGDAPAYLLFTRSDVKTVQASIGGIEWTFDVERHSMHLFETGAAILTLELVWRQADGERLTLADAQRIIDYLRRS